MIPYLLVGAGGAIGAMLRYGYSSLMGRVWPSDFPHWTLAINVVGSLLMGLLVGVLARTLPEGQENIRLFAAVGVLGGFTTFSAFSLDAITLLQRGQLAMALAYILLSVLFSIAGVYVGLLLTRGALA
jgi:CrcB protein